MAVDFSALAKHIRNQGELDELRRMGLSLVAEMDKDPERRMALAEKYDIPAEKADWPAMYQILKDAVDRVFEDGFAGFENPIEVRPLLPVSKSGPMADKLDELGRFAIIRIKGYAQADLEAFKTSLYDFAYDFFEAINWVMESQLLFSLVPEGVFGEGVKCYENPTGPIDPPGLDWSLTRMGVDVAWGVPGSVERYGAGIRVGHPDTGYSDHPEFEPARLLIADGHDFQDYDNDARDEMITTITNTHPAHGTSTGTLIMGIRSPTMLDRVVGVAPEADLVPIRCCNSTALIYSSRIASAVLHAIDKGCHVISISLGALWVPGLEDAVNLAVENNIIVIASAGQCVWFVAYPARFDRCMAVTASTFQDTHWDKASRGSSVVIAAPGTGVRVADFDENMNAGYSLANGTSFSCAYVAGVAALWLAHHGRDALIAQYGAVTKLQYLFEDCVKQTAAVPPGWDTGTCGAGIIIAHLVLQCGLPAVDQAPPPTGSDDPSIFEQIIDLFMDIFGSSSAEEMSESVQALMGVDSADAAARELAIWGPEILNVTVLEGGALPAIATAKKGDTRVLPHEVIRPLLIEFGSNRLRERLERGASDAG